MTSGPVDVVVVGAGPTGLALAAHLAAHGVRPHVIDRAHDRVHESRALAIQPRTLEVLAGLGVTDTLLAHGNRTVRLRIHAGGRETAVPLFDFGPADTAYPYLLFLSQAETERCLSDHLAGHGITVERGVELVELQPGQETVAARLRRDDGREEYIRARYVVGCDGAHSTVRAAAGIGFEGSSYPQTFVLADAEADGIEPDAAHAYLSPRGMLFFFPLATPVAWRLLAMRPPTDPTPPGAPVTLDEVQTLADTYTDASVRLRDPVWMTNFRLHHRAATRYRAGRIFLAGDAAHVHSPAGAQGMNTGIQDAVNLAWKLAHTLRGVAPPDVLDTYHCERAPVGATVLRFTDRAFTIATSTNPLIRFARTRIAPAVIPLVLTPKAARRLAFRTVSQLAIHYRTSPLSVDATGSPRRGPKAGDRVPDAFVRHDGLETTLHRITATPGWHLLLCGPTSAWSAHDSSRIRDRPDVLAVHHLTAADTPGAVHDADGHAHRRLGLATGDTAAYLIRPDGHIGYRCGGHDLTGLRTYLRRWLTGDIPPAAGGER